MVDVALDLARYLNAIEDSKFSWIKMYSTDGAELANTFVNDLPDSPDEAMGILRYAGAAPSETFSNPLHVRRPRIQFMIRHPKSSVALQRAEDVMKEVAKIKDQVINGTKYAKVKIVGEPEEIGPDSSKRQRASLNIEVEFYDSIG